MNTQTLPSFAEKALAFQQIVSSVAFRDHGGETLATSLGFDRANAMLHAVGAAGGTVYVIGNGGSAAIAAHIVNDLVNVGGLRATVLHDAALMTCMANDYGYDQAYARMISTWARPEDLLIAISSSGNSANIRNAVAQMKQNGGAALTLSGFKPGNPLRGLGDLNLWLDSGDYGMVEVGHLFLLHHMADRLRVEKETP
ncbi:D-sedoheptulose-7-phosphate isomerase [Acanthopleuribacter pedis]|uniref:SIS domain-containing protein n=1 Tax=Acanthopleuribacter pedis TaxID=442870 RepID=A0A8J7U476_9BACT|nr:SIS domain-containing protein [Acanthopleuribacter pedis]MBO1317991.1 SIS domain-containing protein [Acanthopleuribacter pedis]